MLSSTAGALQYQGVRLGEFLVAGDYLDRPYYKQRDTEGSSDVFLYYQDNEWWVYDKLGESKGWLRSRQSGPQPPASYPFSRVLI